MPANSANQVEENAFFKGQLCFSIMYLRDWPGTVLFYNFVSVSVQIIYVDLKD